MLSHTSKMVNFLLFASVKCAIIGVTGEHKTITARRHNMHQEKAEGAPHSHNISFYTLAHPVHFTAQSQGLVPQFAPERLGHRVNRGRGDFRAEIPHLDEDETLRH
eukprot:763301-Hanusia_phi.AAC.3